MTFQKIQCIPEKHKHTKLTTEMKLSRFFKMLNLLSNFSALQVRCRAFQVECLDRHQWVLHYVHVHGPVNNVPACNDIDIDRKSSLEWTVPKCAVLHIWCYRNMVSFWHESCETVGSSHQQECFHEFIEIKVWDKVLPPNKEQKSNRSGFTIQFVSMNNIRFN